VKAIRDRVAGLDVHKDSVVACAQLVVRGKTDQVRTTDAPER
jgi:hypothetical protein